MHNFQPPNGVLPVMTWYYFKLFSSEPCEDDIYIVDLGKGFPDTVPLTETTQSTLKDCIQACSDEPSCTALVFSGTDACGLYEKTFAPDEPIVAGDSVVARLPECKYVERKYISLFNSIVSEYNLVKNTCNISDNMKSTMMILFIRILMKSRRYICLVPHT